MCECLEYDCDHCYKYNLGYVAEDHYDRHGNLIPVDVFIHLNSGGGYE